MIINRKFRANTWEVRPNWGPPLKYARTISFKPKVAIAKFIGKMQKSLVLWKQRKKRLKNTWVSHKLSKYFKWLKLTFRDKLHIHFPQHLQTAKYQQSVEWWHHWHTPIRMKSPAKRQISSNRQSINIFYHGLINRYLTTNTRCGHVVGDFESEAKTRCNFQFR